MRKCVIHIGMHKTGSSSIQDSLRGYQRDGYHFPDIDHATTLISIFSSSRERALRSRQSAGKNLDLTDRETLEARLRRVVESSSTDTLILSCEGLYSLLDTDDAIRMRDYFTQWFDDIEIVGYIRSPASYRSSAFQTVVKSNGAATFDSALAYKPYRPCFEKFDDVFGRDNVSLFKFQSSLFPGGDVVRHFCDHIGLPIEQERIRRVNESLSRELVVILYLFNRIRAREGGDRVIDRSVVRTISRSGIPGTRFSLAYDLMKPTLEQNRSDIAWMEQRLGASLHDDAPPARSTDIRSEADLLRPDPALDDTLDKLSVRLKPRLTEAEYLRFEQLVAEWHGLHGVMAARDTAVASA